MHKKKQKSSSTQRPHHHRVVVPVVLIIKLSCYHQRKSWFISLTSRYNFFYKTNNFINEFIFNIIELYFLKKISVYKNKDKIIEYYSKFIKKNQQSKLFNLDSESLFMDFKLKLLNE